MRPGTHTNPPGKAEYGMEGDLAIPDTSDVNLNIEILR